MPHTSPQALYGDEAKPVSLYRLHCASVRAFQGNAEDLDTAMAALEAALRSDAARPPGTLPHPLPEPHRRVGRRLFNYIAAAGALVDHSHRIKRSLATTDTTFLPQYQEHVARFATPARDLVNDLRDFALHYALPVTYSSVRGGQSYPAPQATLFLGVEELRAWTKWPAATRGYLAAMQSDIELRSLVAGYTDAVASLHAWWGPLLRAWAQAHVASGRALPSPTAWHRP